MYLFTLDLVPNTCVALRVKWVPKDLFDNWICVGGLHCLLYWDCFPGRTDVTLDGLCYIPS